MRPLILAATLVIANATQVAAQTMPTFPPTSYPEPGSFCGLLTFCAEAAPKEGV